MSFYEEWGFTESPFDTNPLDANDKGEHLFVSRNTEIENLKILIGEIKKWSCIDGANGIGKTSLINVATYSLYKNFITKRSGKLIIPCKTVFQLTKDSTLKSSDELTNEVIRSIADTLFSIENELSFHTKYFNFNKKEELRSWLNDPLVTSRGFGAGPVSLSANTSINETSGFQNYGLNQIVTSWLKELFPTQTEGAIVCIFDNMELLETSRNARSLLEALRDTLFKTHGVKIILCGAKGIIPAIASPRINGYLQKSIKIEPFKPDDATKILESRIAYFSKDKGVHYLPFNSNHFSLLNEICNKNIRDLLNYIDQYCTQIRIKGIKPETTEEKDKEFLSWLDEISEDAAKSVKKFSGRKAWSILEKAKQIGGEFSHADMESLGEKNQGNFSQYISSLESDGLLSVTIDDDDKRRRNISITDKGYLALYKSSAK